MYPLLLEPPSHLSPTHPSWLSQSPSLSSLSQQIPMGCVFYVWWCAGIRVPPTTPPALSRPHPHLVHNSVLYICVSIPTFVFA